MRRTRQQTRRQILGLMGLAGLSPTLSALAQAYPSKQTRIVVGFTAGGPSDIVGRIAAQQLSERLGTSVIVDNRPGAAGTIGADIVAHSPPDGYTLYLASQTSHAVAPYLLTKANFDPVKDVTTIIRVVHNPLLMVVPAASPYKSLADIVNFARANPGKINFGTGGIGSSPHMSMELFKKVAKINITPIHYKGDSAAIVDLLSSQVDMLTSSISALMPYVESGKLRPIAITGAKRSPVVPQIPTIAESGYEGYEVLTWFGLVGPPGMPKDIVDRINKEMSAAIATPAVRQQMLKMGFEIVPNTPEEFNKYLNEEATKWRTLIRELNLKAEG
ncbi:MAG TPA: tripartite tricarboxylate transporter substrate binding protein [Burkholderiales bacterium]|nr:tripartite tricarboxylate transporter substrate binding protein [Burkholderiales bacterium]